MPRNPKRFCSGVCIAWSIDIAVASWKDCDAETDPGGRLNKKDGLTRYGDSHVKDKTS